MSATYQDVINEEAISSLEQLNSLFDGKISDEWVSNYYEDSMMRIGNITIQRFFDFTFIYDYTGNPQNEGIDACSIPDSRVVGAFGISNSNINFNNRPMMKKFIGRPGAYDAYGGKYDRGHFIAHLSGGPIDINLFPKEGMLTADGVNGKNIVKWKGILQRTQVCLFFRGLFIMTLVVVRLKFNLVIVIEI